MINRFAASLRVAAVMAALASAASAQVTITGYEYLLNWSDLPNARLGVQAHLASSYDPAGSNDDFNNYLWPGFLDSRLQTVPSVPVVIADIHGPGILTRFQMPHGTANQHFQVKLTIDGTTVLQTTSDVLLGGDYGYITAPLVATRVGGQVSYEPIVFSESLRIESENLGAGWLTGHHYYQYDYLTLPSAAGLTPYSGTLAPDQLDARDGVVNMINQVGENPAGEAPDAPVIMQGPATVEPGQTFTIATLTGSGQVRRLNLKMASAGDTELEGLRLRVRYGTHPALAIDVPVAHFFAAGFARVPYKSLPLGTDSPEGFYCYWPMPYRHGMVIQLYNTTAAPIAIDSAAVEYLPGPVAMDAGYLHAEYRYEETQANQQYHELFRAAGEGSYVGSFLYVKRNGIETKDVCILEGDDVITVDGDHLLHGNGMEDAYNGGYYYNHIGSPSDHGDVLNPYSGTGPYSGLLRMNFDDTGDGYVRTDQYRWLIGDAVPFTQGIEVKIENWGRYVDTTFGSTAFYYLVLRGDFNGDGVVTHADYTIWADTFGNDGTAGKEDLRADGNGDGRITHADYTLWADYFGRTMDQPLEITQPSGPEIQQAPSMGGAAPASERRAVRIAERRQLRMERSAVRRHRRAAQAAARASR